MELISIRDLYKNKENYLDKTITIGGWVRSIRDSKTFGFIVVNDGTFFEPLQIVYHDKMENFAEISKLNVGAAIIVNSHLRFRQIRSKLKVHQHRIIRFRRSATALSISELFRI